MKLFKTLIFFYIVFFMSFTSHVQKETFDIVSYTLPNGWQKQQVEGGVQLFVSQAIHFSLPSPQPLAQAL